MTHDNRVRLTVDPDGKWQLYANKIPAGAVPLGTVTRTGADTGALVRYGATVRREWKAIREAQRGD